MDWNERMNAALDDIENRLTEKISYREAAARAGCSAQHFQRMFAFMTEIPLSEYIRRRRLTLAAFDLQHSAIKVVDVALKYGYESPEAFARAFQNLHGTTPSKARSEKTALKAYPRLAFQFTLKGVAEMNYRLERAEEFRIAGRVETVNTERAYEEIGPLWAKAGEEGLFGRLWKLRDEDSPVRGILGVLADGEWGRGETFDYYFCVPSKKEVPADLSALTVPDALWVVFDAPGTPDGLPNIWKRMYTEWLPSAPYELANVPAIECYLPPEENRNELWIPVVPQKERTAEAAQL
ncbi:GyrI-like domain-containing protein [Saccharibacillus sp. CPCC 101409]|uniref:AraC family transcriptional regulator n=1 Tax=Saccharibacillus sp. CPCC 101409 TaxID=3058041 RepID=UPI002671C591|nr:GyrI-like domain-containing protein [Saccharibacillus sp. CPCC 101409]MDO3411451.1 GyrI-like domain-containing protein [Saccharibacillus sp. CPCC 101409]